jgi:hypothetical protein
VDQRLAAPFACAIGACFCVHAALADDQTDPLSASQAAATANPPSPAFSGLNPSPAPLNLDLGPLGHQVLLGGVASGLVLAQEEPDPDGRDHAIDFSNAQVYVSKSDGLIQYYVQAGLYSIPVLGVPYVKSTTATTSLFDPAPVAFLELAPGDGWSIEVGKLPSLVGAEHTFTFENMNIERGLLWNQGPTVSRGIQINYARGPFAASVSWNDGFYSDRYGWISGSASWTFDPADTLKVTAADNLKKSEYFSRTTPLLQNNEKIYDLVFTHSQDQWTLQPYVQYTSIPAIGGTTGTVPASTWGAAVLASYKFGHSSWLYGFSLPVRVEYIHSSGPQSPGVANVLGFGPGADALSVTVTPTYQYKIYYARVEFSGVDVAGITEFSGLGPGGHDHIQLRGLLETGVLF